MAMAQPGHRDATGQIEELASLLIPQAGALAADRNDVRRRVVGNHDLIEGLASYLHDNLLISSDTLGARQRPETSQ
ncbi:hypothetical protein WQQ_05840 [Hydrocarboniphaga effusa AP103]|uniref:Uncharacterized protein n=1 Tax=Hydrocarboniphaga effusa AP103 TaxID=1172194 RepID=I7ZFI3_9GAMM|nr:hypothetical protein WQQ_05840 [Hydrocarboniphaga effusa AP103]